MEAIVNEELPKMQENSKYAYDFGGFDIQIEDELLGIDSSNKFNEIDLLFKEIKMSISN
jgi:uncharacterized protein (DUF1015 family)